MFISWFPFGFTQFSRLSSLRLCVVLHTASRLCLRRRDLPILKSIYSLSCNDPRFPISFWASRLQQAFEIRINCLGIMPVVVTSGAKNPKSWSKIIIMRTISEFPKTCPIPAPAVLEPLDRSGTATTRFTRHEIPYRALSVPAIPLRAESEFSLTACRHGINSLPATTHSRNLMKIFRAVSANLTDSPQAKARRDRN